MFWGCLWQEIFGGNLFEEVASQEIFFCNDIYVGTNNHEKNEQLLQVAHFAILIADGGIFPIVYTASSLLGSNENFALSISLVVESLEVYMCQ